MKILQVIPSFAPAWRHGGPIHALYGLTRQLARLGHQVTVMTTNVHGPDVLDVPLERPVWLDGVAALYFPVEQPRWWCFSRRLAHALQRHVEDFDLVHVHSIFLWPTTVASFWCRRYGVPYILRPAGSLDPVCLTKPYDPWWLSLASRVKKAVYLNTIGRMDLNRASAIHFTSEEEMEAARPLKLRPPGFVVPLGIEPEEMAKAPVSLKLRKRYPQLQGKKIVLFLSRFDRKKGLDLLIEALSQLLESRNDFAFVLAGSGTSEYQAEVAARIKRSGLQERTVSLGSVEGQEKWSLLREADVFVLPSHRENFGVAVVEAMAVGLAVVISNGVNISRDVKNAGAGLVTGLDSGDIAAAVDHLLANDHLRRKMGQKGRALVRRQFTVEHVAHQTVRMYEDVLVAA